MPRSWAKGQKQNPIQPQSPEKEAAKMLAYYARLYSQDRATKQEVVEAYREWVTHTYQG